MNSGSLMGWTTKALWLATLAIALWLAMNRGGRYVLIQSGWLENYPVMLDTATGRMAPLAGCYRGGAPGYAGALLIAGCTPFRPGTGKLRAASPAATPAGFTPDRP